jgi:hypothetical protein
LIAFHWLQPLLWAVLPSAASTAIDLPLANQIAQITVSAKFPRAIDCKKKSQMHSKVDTVRFQNV